MRGNYALVGRTGKEMDPLLILSDLSSSLLLGFPVRSDTDMAIVVFEVSIKLPKHGSTTKVGLNTASIGKEMPLLALIAPCFKLLFRKARFQ